MLIVRETFFWIARNPKRFLLGFHGLLRCWFSMGVAVREHGNGDRDGEAETQESKSRFNVHHACFLF